MRLLNLKMQKIMKLIMKLLALFIPFFFVCCNNEKNDVRTFDMTSHDFEAWNKLISIEKYVVLEETENSMLAGIDKCVLGDDAIYVFVRKFDKVFKFSLEGDFISTVGEKGRAKNEYINIRDIAYDYKEKKLVIADSRGLLWFDSTGKFQNRLSLDDSWEIDVCKDGNILTYGLNKDFSVRAVRDGKTVGLRKHSSYVFFSGVFYNHQDENMVVSDYGQFYIDKYGDGKLLRKYEFDFGDEALPEKLRPQSSSEFDKVDDMDEYFKCLQCAQETNKWLYVVLRGPHQTIYQGYVNKDKGDVFFGEAPQGDGYGVIGTYHDKFYGLLYPEYVGDNSHVKKFLIENGLQDSHNPILVFLKINEKL